VTSVSQSALVEVIRRRCGKCDSVKPLDEFYICGGKPHTYCKECERRRRKERTRKLQDEKYGDGAPSHREMWRRIKGAKEGFKYCVRCEKEKPLSSFYSGNKTNKGGRSSYCKPCAAHWAKKNSASSPKNRMKIALNTARGSAGRKNIPCSVTLDDLMEMWDSQRGKCFYSGTPMSFAGDRIPESVSVDRIDSSKGYTLGNVVLCCNIVNLMKRNMSISELTRWCKLILEHMEEVPHR
jgi:hypothetical protein